MTPTSVPIDHPTPTRSSTRARALALLVAAIASECSGTLLLAASAGFTRLLPTLGVVAGYAGAILLFSRALERGLTLGIAYGTLTGCGLVVATVASAALLGHALGTLQVLGLVLIMVGALVLQRRPGARS